VPKKILFVTVLLLLVSAQALAASCDVRCALMVASTHDHARHTDMQMPECHGMSIEQDQKVSLTASDSCASTGCGTELKAIVKSADQKDAGSGKLFASVVALLFHAFGDSASDTPTAFVSLSRAGDSRPLAQRPGSSLRI
jgi:hypothetical protein